MSIKTIGVCDSCHSESDPNDMFTVEARCSPGNYTNNYSPQLFGRHVCRACLARLGVKFVEHNPRHVEPTPSDTPKETVEGLMRRVFELCGGGSSDAG